MLTAVLFGLAASSALVIGALAGARWSPPKQVTGVLLAFASGALISALAFELFPKNLAIARPEPVACVLALSPAVYLKLFGWLIWLFDQESKTGPPATTSRSWRTAARCSGW